MGRRGRSPRLTVGTMIVAELLTYFDIPIV